MKQFVEGAVNANGISHHYWRSTPRQVKSSPLRLRRSKSRPPLLLLHAATENSQCWARVAAALRPDYDITTPDARGHGLSEAPENGYGLEERANDVASVIETLALERPVLIGHALGAETAIAVAALFPDLVRGVVLEDPPWPGRFWGSTPEERAERAEQWRSEITHQKHQSKQDLIAAAREQHPGWPDEELERWAAARMQVSPYLPNMIFAPRRRWSDYLRRAECPLLLITGEVELGATVNPRTVQEAAAFWKNGSHVHIPGAGHHIHREKLEDYLEAVTDFIERNIM